jgi:hypothetical protein
MAILPESQVKIKQPCRAPKDACRAAKHENGTIFVRLSAKPAMPGLKARKAAFF